MKPYADNGENQLESALYNWRDRLLEYLQRETSKSSQAVRDAEDGLGIAHRNRGQIAEDVIENLWDRLEKNCILLCRLARISDAIQEMNLPELVTLFARTEKVKVYPWEGETWELPSSMF